MRRTESTRDRIIRAASRVLGARGYDATTLKQIAREAGAAPGLVHYYFGGKEQLLVEVLREALRRYTESMAAAREREAHGEALDAALTEPARRAVEEPEWYRLRYELFALGLRNPAIEPGVAELLAGGRSGIAEAVKAFGADRDADAASVAAVLLACFDGLALQRLVQPDFDLEGAYAVLRRIVEALGAERVAAK